MRMSPTYYTVNLPQTEEFGKYNRALRREIMDRVREHRLYPLMQRRNTKSQAEAIRAQMARDMSIPFSVNETSSMSF
jgi:hypothetical protein